METGPPINLQPQVQQTQPEPPQNNPIMQAIRIRINLDIVWLVAKLCLAVIIFSRNGTWARTIFLGAVATILFLFQTGAIGIPTLGTDN
jgi:hypothetical protein